MDKNYFRPMDIFGGNEEPLNVHFKIETTFDLKNIK